MNIDMILASRNPYFSGFSLAIFLFFIISLLVIPVAILILVDFPLQYVCYEQFVAENGQSRNPYFSGFSLAITLDEYLDHEKEVAILILVDFPLQ